MLHRTSGADAGQIPPPPRQSSERYVKSAALAEQPSASTPFLELITGSTCEPCRNRHQTPHLPWPVSRAPRARGQQGTKSTASQAQAGARGSDPPAPLRPCTRIGHLDLALWLGSSQTRPERARHGNTCGSISMQGRSRPAPSMGVEGME